MYFRMLAADCFFLSFFNLSVCSVLRVLLVCVSILFFIFLYVCMQVRVCMCVCVCVRQIDRHTDRHTETKSDLQKIKGKKRNEQKRDLFVSLAMCM